MSHPNLPRIPHKRKDTPPCPPRHSRPDHLLPPQPQPPTPSGTPPSHPHSHHGHNGSGSGLRPAPAHAQASASSPVIKFSDHFWGDGGFEKISDRMLNGSLLLESMSRHIQDRVNLEEHYAKSLQKMARDTKRITELGSTLETWQVFKLETDATSRVHVQLAQSLRNEVLTPMKELENRHKAARQGVLTEMANLGRDLQKQEKKLNQCKSRYEQLSNSMDAAKVNLEQAKTGGKKASDVGKLQIKLDKLMGEWNASERDYQTETEKFRVYLEEQWEGGVGRLLNKCQTIEETRILDTRRFLKKCLESHDATLPLLTEISVRMDQSTNLIDPHRDLHSFAEKEHTGSAPNRQAPTFEAKRVTTPQANAPPTSSSQSSLFRRTMSMRTNAINPQQQRKKELPRPPGGGGSAPNLGTIENTPQPTAVVSALASSEGRERSQSDVALDAAVSEEVRDEMHISNVRARFDFIGESAAELDFFVNEVIEVLDKHKNGWWLGRMLEDGRIGFFPRNYVVQA
eukprot:TRINITY_DN5861_c0_g1_i1.p1 TRINITY_DN5861_c0_g1~~TRINITY_DN5861_c0_g1_i1.p1  ORF type:complete len:514 (+),score=75.53 TRINITY_DN5861_c0_g1_i1:195-1736(+)